MGPNYVPKIGKPLPLMNKPTEKLEPFQFLAWVRDIGINIRALLKKFILKKINSTCSDELTHGGIALV